ncbi:MAG: hypothetical protein R3A50_18090 [Saprospiraceae bacterium]|nr:hypothetical protein [Saprospiraceae bacterium]MCB9345840.1 hypothetical protein [Lewinellaceae bacterium]
MKILVSIVFIVCGLIPFVGLNQTAQLEADSFSVETGNPYTLRIVVSGDRTPDTVSFSSWGSFLSPDNILSKRSWIRRGDKHVMELTVLFFDADTLQLPALPVVFEETDTIFTPSRRLTIYPTPSPDDLNDMAPIKDIRREKVQWTDYLPLIISVLGVLGALALIFWWYLRASKKAAITRVIETPAHELALKKLEALEKQSLWQNGQLKEFCAAFTFILREYFEKRYRILALESTSEDLPGMLQKTDFPPEFVPGLKELLEQTDLVKFAKGQPREELYADSLIFARKVISETRLDLEENKPVE